MRLQKNSTITHILSLVPYKIFPPQMGGQKCAVLFSRYLAAHVKLTMVTTANNQVESEPGFEVLPVLSNSRLRYINPLLFFRFRRIIKQRQITHVMLEHPYYGWLGALLKWFCGVRLVIRSQNIEALRFKSFGKWWWGILWNYEKFSHRIADANLFITGEDHDYAIRKFRVSGRRCITSPYGFKRTGPPAAAERAAARQQVQALHGIEPGYTLLLFNGTLDYLPNMKALDAILQHINPELAAAPEFRYKIMVCGKGLPSGYDDLKDYADQNIIYAGFVNDIDLYYLAADILINPVIEGGGIKTKLVEALGFNMNVVTTANGAIGVPVNITGGKMAVIADNDWPAFAAAIIQSRTGTDIPAALFEHFYWGKIAEKAAAFISPAS